MQTKPKDTPDGRAGEVRISPHARDRMKSRRIAPRIARADAQSYLRSPLARPGQQVALMDEEHDCTIIAQIRWGWAVITTVLDGTRRIIKDGTLIIPLSLLKRLSEEERD